MAKPTKSREKATAKPRQSATSRSPANRKRPAGSPVAGKASASASPARRAQNASHSVDAANARHAANARDARTSDRPPAAAERPSPALAASIDEAGLGWIAAGKGYALSLDGGKLVARNDEGKRLSSVPKAIRDGDVADQLEALRDWLVEHDRECLATVDQWMLRSLPVPRAVLERVWDDPAWRAPLENAVVVAVDGNGKHDPRTAGLFRGIDANKGIGVVDLDGETLWLDADRIAIPHPILITELDGWRELVVQLGVTQRVSQLMRETHPRPPGLTAHTIDQFEDGKFAMLMHAVGKARSLGFQVRGGFAVCKVWDGGAVTEARYWIGADSPEVETYTGALSWVDPRQHTIPAAAVGPVAFSEGMRMASSIYAARVVEKGGEAS